MRSPTPRSGKGDHGGGRPLAGFQGAARMAQGAAERGVTEPVGRAALGRDQRQVVGFSVQWRSTPRSPADRANSAAHCSSPSSLGRAIPALLQRRAGHYDGCPSAERDRQRTVRAGLLIRVSCKRSRNGNRGAFSKGVANAASKSGSRTTSSLAAIRSRRAMVEVDPRVIGRGHALQHCLWVDCNYTCSL